METGHDFEKNSEELSPQDLEREIEWMRSLLQLEEKEIPLPESLRSEHLLKMIQNITPDEASGADPTAAPGETARQTGDRNKNKVLFFKLVSCAACLALVLFGWRQMSVGEGAITQRTSASSAGTSSSGVAVPAVPAPMATAPAPVLMATPAPMAASANEEGTELDLVGEGAEAVSAPVELPEQPVAADYQEVYGAVEDIYTKLNVPRPESSRVRRPATGGGAMEDVAVLESPMAAPAPRANANPSTAGGSAKEADFSSTNVQVEGIDESDIIKTDGVYLYHYRFDPKTAGAEVTIVTANGLKLLSTIELPEYTDAELYVQGDRLVLVQTASEERVRELLETLEPDPAVEAENDPSSRVIVPDYNKPDGTSEFELIDMMETVVYDLSDRKNPRETGRYQQDGSYVSSRLSGDSLYLVTNKNLYSFTPDDGISPYARYLPIMGENGKATPLDAQRILLPPYRESLNYAVVSTLDLGAQTRETKAVLGMADQIMMSGDALFLAASIPPEGETSRWNRTDTGITRFAVTDGALGYLSSGRVPGIIDNQFSLDEHKGNLRIATTTRDEEGESVNNVFVYNEKMEKIGGVEGLAPGERIYSARFLGDTAYIVTFRQTDPLFVIDLSNPKNPVVKGELKIPGFSEYLHPIDENTLLGFGQNTIANQWGGSSEDGIKLSLFDVSNPTDPKEISSYLLGNSGSSSEALDNHKAFLYDSNHSMVGFPATIRTATGASVSRPWSGDSDVTFSGYLLFGVKPDGFELLGTLPSEGGDVAEGFQRTDPTNAIDRGVYIGETFYTVASGRIRAYALDGLTLIGELSYSHNG